MTIWLHMAWLAMNRFGCRMWPTSFNGFLLKEFCLPKVPPWAWQKNCQQAVACLAFWLFRSISKTKTPLGYLSKQPIILCLYMARIWQEEILWVEEQEKFRIDHFSMQENQRLRSLLLHQSARGNAPHSCHWCVMVLVSRESHVIKTGW